MRTAFPIASLACVSMLSLSACDVKRDSTGTSTNTTSTDGTTSTPAPRSTTTPPASNPSPTPAPDNTARNKRDAPGDTKTPMDQSESAEHIKITADIRAAVIAMDGMSTNGKNIKIITDKAGVVTLRGVVASQSEKDKIDAKARSFAGVTNVVNQLEVKAG